MEQPPGFPIETRDHPDLAPGENTGGWRGDGRCTSFG
jgi:hypothetical protein